ncbi:MAG: ADP-ribosylglycohydrolase family protein, partial [Mariniphaga sp.]|nr:ADP-ribosylglycohydrolase family protein [Mariniphaga sp.]
MKRNLLKLIIPVIAIVLASCGQKTEKVTFDSRTISTEVLKDKIAGGWAGKMIGVTYGAPTEFKAKTATF